VIKSGPIQMCVPRLPSYSELKPYLERIDNSHIYSNFGPLVNEFESRLAEYFQIPVEQLATCSNATDAIEGAIRTSGSVNEIWDAPSWTFTATAAALVASGASFTFRDIDQTQRIRIDSGFKNIVEVLPFGEGLDFDRHIYTTQNLLIDAAASFDALKAIELPTDRRVGIVLSFHATKTLSTGEGGLFISNDPEWVLEFKKWTNFGMWGSRISTIPGSNSKMNEYSAAIGLSSLDSWPKARLDWQAQMKQAKKLSFKYGLNMNRSLERGIVSPYWIVTLPSSNEVSSLIHCLNAANVDWRRWWEHGCAKMNAYSHVHSEQLRETDTVSKSQIGLPLHLSLDEKDWLAIEESLSDFARNY
jgi:dTDP-4-amino-4,6-dideoxygalactose transaminase